MKSHNTDRVGTVAMLNQHLSYEHVNKVLRLNVGNQVNSPKRL